MDNLSELNRLHALYDLDVLDSRQEDDFDNLVQLASQICHTPVSLISLVDYDRQWFKANKGFGWAETSRTVSFCAHTIWKDGVMVVKDATQDVRFAANPLVTGDPFIRFYAGAPLVTSGGHALGSLCVIDQQTRELSQEQLFALETLAKQVVSLLEMRARLKRKRLRIGLRDKMLSVISHDVRGPLMSIRKLLELFGSGMATYEDMQRLSDPILASIDKTDGLLGELIHWCRSEAEEETVLFEDVQIAAVLEEVVGEIEAQAAQKGNKIIVGKLPAVLLPGHRAMLKFILRNILSNANKFTQNGLLRLEAEQKKDALVVTIKDTGVGISKARLDSLFQAGEPGCTVGTANEKGQGLGLLLAQDFACKHKGHIEILSEEGEGTEVKVRLPLKTGLLHKKVRTDPKS